MDLSNYSSQSHVAQRSRRDKLRVQQTAQDYPRRSDQLYPNHGEIPNVRCGGNVSYSLPVVSSEMLNFATNSSQASLVRKETPRVCGDQENCLPQRNCDWVDSFSGGVTVGIQSNQNVYTIGEGSMSVTKAYDLPSPLYRKPSFDMCQGVNSSNFINPSSEFLTQNSEKYYQEMHYKSLPFYQNAIPLVEVSNPRMNCTKGFELASIVDQSNVDNRRTRDVRHTIASDSVTQGLSLSLSRVHSNKTHPSRLPEVLVYPGENLKSDYLTSKAKSFVAPSRSKVLGNTGPLGPFTGYATILQSSKFLRPAQQLLDEMCIVNASKSAHTCEVLKNKTSYESKGFGDVVHVVDEPRVSSPRFNGSNENSEEALVRINVVESFRPEYQQKKAKLLFMQEEVSRRHTHYHQQMEMVASSFKSVAGLNAVTPYISQAVKAVSRRFHSIKNAILDQLKCICKALGENFSSTFGDAMASTSKGDASSSRLNFIGPLMKQKKGEGNLGLSETHQPHAWRPQRGLPERAVAVLRAWLFEHFLHPYPTDTDKHMLASQTGLSRNQVSNWFINARVRVWKPMVEEIHTLETNVLARSNSNPEGAISRADHSDQPTDLHATSSNLVAGDEYSGYQWDRAMEKRLRTEYQIPASTGADTSFMGFMPYQRSGLEVDIGGLSAVCLTLGLRQSPEEMSPQQEEHQNDFVG